jgi:hypothetical protein
MAGRLMSTNLARAWNAEVDLRQGRQTGGAQQQQAFCFCNTRRCPSLHGGGISESLFHVVRIVLDDRLAMPLKVVTEASSSQKWRYTYTGDGGRGALIA